MSYDKKILSVILFFFYNFYRDPYNGLSLYGLLELNSTQLGSFIPYITYIT